MARERALKKADRPKEVRKVILDHLKALIAIFKGEEKERKASVVVPGNTAICDSDEPGSPEGSSMNGSSNGAPN